MAVDKVIAKGKQVAAHILEASLADIDFKDTTVPTFYTVVDGADHLTSGRLAWEAVIAWMLWHLAGQEEQWKKEFV